MHVGNLPAGATDFHGIDLNRCDALVGDLDEVLAGPAEAAPEHVVVDLNGDDASVGDDVEGVLQAGVGVGDTEWDAW